MGMNVGRAVDLETVTIRASLRRVVFRGVCEQKFNITLEDWATLKKRVATEIRAAKRRAKANPVNQAIAEHGGLAGMTRDGII